ncbi:MAG: hypothetical protein IJ192_05540 [Clostridia bacterium]|nr:hypothetical protein [Clostridia bacterium]
MLEYVLIGVFVVTIVAVVIFTVMRNKAIKENGIETNAVVSRVEKDADPDSNSYTCYVTYTTVYGQNVEARLNRLPDYTHVGDIVSIKYLPKKPKYVLFIK